MIAEEWIRTHFTCDDEGIVLDNNRHGILSSFIPIFGSTIEAALATGRNPVDALCALPEAEKRGWGPDFEVWKQLGIGG